MSDIRYEGGLIVNIEFRIDADRLAKMPPKVIEAMLRGVAAIVTAREFALVTDRPPRSPLESPTDTPEQT